ncbi:MAG: hypothetical protein ACSHX9_05650 [Luteolibacter sp.]
MKPTYLAAILLSPCLLLSSCSEKETTPSTEKSESDTLSEFILTEAPDEALDIAELRTTAKPGDEVVFTGNIIGSDQVFIENHSVMIVGDPNKLTSCDRRPDDPCTTPWDVCCDDREVIKASIVTVQLIDADGKPFREGLKGVGGMKELSSVTVTGEVAEGSNAENMVVNATGIFVQP